MPTDSNISGSFNPLTEKEAPAGHCYYYVIIVFVCVFFGVKPAQMLCKPAQMRAIRLCMCMCELVCVRVCMSVCGRVHGNLGTGVCVCQVTHPS